ncbi:MAG: phosphatase PAP2 family protein [Acidobacteriota bacterium]
MRLPARHHTGQGPAERAAEPPFRSLFLSLAADAARLGRLETLEVLAGGGLTAAVVKSHDVELKRRAVSDQKLEAALDGGEILGGGTVQIGGALVAYVLGRTIHRPAAAIVGAELFRAQLLSGGLTQALKFSVGRRRPDGARYSFPSGHASASFATAAVLERRWGWRVGVPAYGAAAYVAASRLSENRHYASDVAFGAALGIVAGRAVTLRHGTRSWSAAPYVSRDGRGVMFTMVARAGGRGVRRAP